MYKTKDINPEDLSKVEIKNQAEIVQYIGSELDLKEAYELIKKESSGFTKANANAEKADALLYAIYKGEAVATPAKEAASEWKNIPKEQAISLFKEKQKVYAIGANGEKILIESEGVFSLADKFVIHTPIEKQPETLTREQIRILKVKKETELALLALKLKQKRKSA